MQMVNYYDHYETEKTKMNFFRSFADHDYGDMRISIIGCLQNAHLLSHLIQMCLSYVILFVS
jgi:hypothetical protein